MSQLRPFDIGYVPKGWARGQALWVTGVSKEQRGQVRPQCMYEDLSTLETRDITDDVAALDFNHLEAERVNAWLAWWTEEARMEAIRDRLMYWQAPYQRSPMPKPVTDEERAQLESYDRRVAEEAGEFA